MGIKFRVFLAATILLAALGGPFNRASALDPSWCVGIASDSNGYGHVTFLLGPGGDVGIIFVQPLWVVLENQLRDLGLARVQVIDRSLSAGGLTSSEDTKYLASIPAATLS